MRTFDKISITLVIGVGLSATTLRAQVGNNNPTGIAGEFSGEVTTGCDYTLYTSTARRSVTDLVVAGGVGAYPLAFGRISTSRYNVGLAVDMGTAGSWLHSYQWSIDTLTTGLSRPTSYTVNFPDGGRMVFNDNSEGNIYGDPYFRSGFGIRQRLQVIWDTQTTGRLYLLLTDGGKVYFTVQRTHPNANYVFTYTLQTIIDPFGQTTTITGSRASGLVTATEPAGRWIKIYYRTITQSSQGALNDKVIDHVTASDGRSVQYTYSAYTTPNGTIYTSLTGVTYFGDSTLQATYTYKNDNVTPDGRPLLSTCNDPMYSGPMVKIAYTYADSSTRNPDGSTVVSGQILSEDYFDGTNVGPAVSSLAILPTPTPSATPSANRQETRGDGKTRTFLAGTLCTFSATNFKGIAALQGLDLTYFYVNSFTDRNGNTTNWTNNVLTGRPIQITYPLTQNDTPAGTPRGTVTYTYGSATCPDPNNRDGNNPYYLYSITDEGGNTTVFLRDASKRITQVNYPDGGTESFTYNSFSQVLTHVMKTGGPESFSYDARGLKQTYRDPYHATGNPTAWYQYDSLDRVSGATDALGSASGDINHTTSFTYNSRGQLLVTTHPVDPVDGQRHAISNQYNVNGTLANVTDELAHLTSFTYDDYRRPRSATTPGHNTPVTAYSYYDANGAGDDYTLTYPTMTHTVSPGGEKITTVYDENRRKASVTVGDGTSDAATTSFGYDSNGNLTSVISPNEQPGQLYAGLSTVTTCDQRNRPMSVTDALSNVTTFKYDAAGRKASITRANGQVVTYDSYDAINRLLQQTVTQAPNPNAVTKYTYYTSGLLHTMQDPHLVTINSNDTYNYHYDLMGRKDSLTYPHDSNNNQSTEAWHYDAAGRVDTFTNRNGWVQTSTYDALNRWTGFSCNDGLTPSVSFGYDTANRMTRIVNPSVNVSRYYFADNLLNAESTFSGGTQQVVTYTYNADGNRATIQYPSGAYSFTYNYTGRNQLQTLVNNSGNGTVATYGYDPDGNLLSRVPDNNAGSAYHYDALDRVTHIAHLLNGNTRTFDYAYDPVGNRKWTKRDNGNGDVFGYDLNDQSISVLLDVNNPDTTGQGNQTINYDANGNRTTFSAYGPADTYTTNNLNQYTARNGSSALYDANGNMTTGVDGSSYVYDAQNRLLSATKAGTAETFTYDGLNRQVSRQIGTAPPTYNVYDGWNLIGEYAYGATSLSVAYLSGAGGLVKNLTTNNYYYQDASGSTSHLADNTGHLIEWYRYDLQGTPFFYNSSNVQIPASASGIRHLFTSQQWYSEVGLYDLRNRFYSPDIGRFLQADPIGFRGDPTNLYRYVGNNPTNFADPNGEFANLIFGAAAGAGVDLAIQLYANGGNWSAVSWGEVGINAAAGALTSGVSALTANVANLGVRVAINATVSAGVGATSQVAINWVKGNPLSNNVASNSALSALFSPFSTVASAATDDASGVLNAVGEALAIAFDNSPQFFEMLYEQQSQGTATNPFGNVNLQLGITGAAGGLGISSLGAGSLGIGEGGTLSSGVTIPDDPGLFGGWDGGWDYENGGQSWGYTPSSSGAPGGCPDPTSCDEKKQ
jgi:RHS repeat-associated protein